MAVCIISTAQQANPNVKGHNDPARAQAMIEVNFDDTHSSFIYFIFFISNGLLIAASHKVSVITNN